MQPVTNRHEPLEIQRDQLRTLKVELMRRLSGALANANGQQHRLFTITFTTPMIHHHAFSPGAAWFFSHLPERECSRLGLGVAMRLTAGGKDRFAKLAAAFSKVTGDWGVADPEHTGISPGAFACFAFDQQEKMRGGWQGFPNAAVFIPALVYQQSGDQCTLSFTTRTDLHLTEREILTRWSNHIVRLLQTPNPAIPRQEQREPPIRVSSCPPDPEWIRLVESAKTEIHDGRFDKVVPARSIRVTRGRPFCANLLMSKLRQLQPRARLFALSHGGKTFAAASPERLVHKQGRNLICDAVGGTAPRDSSTFEDARLGKALLHDSKSLHEHLVVVREIRDKLSPMCTGLSHVATPRLMPLHRLQHLWTQLHGTLAEERPLIEVAASLHPTAAINGFPEEAAGRWLDEKESLPRGWFSGAGGWLDRDGDGELAVLLRCALIEGRGAELFAGAGITAQSDPAAELSETELKFGTMLEALSYA